MEKITTIGLDLAKNVFQVHGVDATGQVVIRRKLRRADVEEFFRRLPAATIGMEACGGAHHWARVLGHFGHRVLLMPPAYVKPYVKRGKTDAADAEAICEAVTRPTMRFVPVKTEAQQAAATELKVRQMLVEQRTRSVNALRCHLTEFGIIAAKGMGRVADLAAIVRDPTDSRLPSLARDALLVLVEQIEDLELRIERVETAMVRRSRADETARRLATIPGIGAITANALQRPRAGPRWVQVGAPLRGVARPCSTGPLEWREGAAGAHLARRQRDAPRIPRARCHSQSPLRTAQPRSGGLGHAPARPPAVQGRSRRPRQQDGAHRLGTAGKGRRIQVAGGRIAAGRS